MVRKYIYPKTNKGKCILVSVGIIFSCILISLITICNQCGFYPEYDCETFFSLNDLEWNVEDKNTSRTSYITPITSSCERKILNNNELAAMIKYSNYSDFLSNDFEHSIVYVEDEIHSLKSVWKLEDGIVTIIIDPNNYPTFLFDNQDVVNNIDGYNVVAQKSNFYSDMYEIDIGIEKDYFGIWIFGGSQNKIQIEKLFNLILNTDIKFEDFQT